MNPASTPATRRAPTDDDLDQLGAAGQLWPLLASCEARLRAEPDAPSATLYRAASLLGLGASELASEGVRGLSGADADSIRDAASQGKPSQIDPKHALAACKANLTALQDRAPAAAAAFPHWTESVQNGTRRFFRCDDGNVLVHSEGHLVRACDDLTASRHARLELDPCENAANVNAMPGILVLHWDAAPWLLERLLRATRARPQGYQPRVLISAQRADSVLDGLAMKNLATLLRQASTRWHIGENAIEEIDAALHDSWRWAIHEHAVAAEPGSDPAVALQACVERARAAQANRLAQLTQTTRDRDPRRTPREWGARYAASSGTHGTPLRVLIPSTRYTTFLRHAAEDLAGAIRRAGDEAHVLLEPESDLRPAATFELSAHAELDPDLTIVANWPRASRPNAWPASAPAVCWVQDMLGNLLDARQGAAQGELDFTTGVLNGSLFRDFQYPVERACFLTTPACPHKFHNAPPAPDTDAVDVAYASHQSETPEAFADRLIGSATPGAERKMISTLVAELMRAPEDAPLTHTALETLTRECLDSAFAPSAVSRIMMMATLPLAERRRRHTTLRWASRICERHGLTLGVYGAGWDRSPYQRWARGPLEHTEQLRSSYASAGCHLHASLASNAHQRVFECALAGGVMLRRGPSPDAPAIQLTLQTMLAAREPDYELNDLQGYRVHTGDDPLPLDDGRFDAVRTARLLCQSPDAPFMHEGELVRVQWIDRDQTLQFARWLPRLPLEQFPDWAYDAADETLFSTEEELETAILRAARDPQWRTATAQSHRACALAHNTTDAFWAKLKVSLTNALLHASADERS